VWICESWHVWGRRAGLSKIVCVTVCLCAGGFEKEEWVRELQRVCVCVCVRVCVCVGGVCVAAALISPTQPLVKGLTVRAQRKASPPPSSRLCGSMLLVMMRQLLGTHNTLCLPST